MTIRRLLKDLDLRIRTIKPSAPISDAMSQLARDDTSALVVTTDDHLVLGILSSSDIVKDLNQSGGHLDRLLVSHLMTHDVISCEATENVQRIEQLMIEHNVRHIPVTIDGVLCAVVNILDIVKFRMQSAEKEAGQLSDYVSGVV